MGGGLFPGQSFHLNPKCIIFSLVLALGYWFSPHKSIPVLVALLYFPYLALAWYDYVYDCKNKLQPTIFPFGRWLYLPFKPPDYQKRYEELPPEYKNTIATWDKFFAFIILGIVLVKISNR
jgi:hypothetical protein